MSPVDEPRIASPITVRLVADSSPEVVAAAFAAGFAGYQVPMSPTAAQLDARFRSENGDAFASYVFSSADEPVAILLISRRGWVSRVAAMGIAPAMRGTGLGANVIRRAVAEARSRDDSRLVLEVIQDNVRAVRLYERAGFRTVRPLWGFTLDAGPVDGAGISPAQEIDPAAGALRAGGFGTADVPWQLQIPSLAAMVRPTRGFTDPAGSVVAMVDASQEMVRLRAIAFDPALSSADAAAFTTSLRRVFPDRPWTAPPIFTDVHRTTFFAPGGWATMDLRQFEMSHPLGAG